MNDSSKRWFAVSLVALTIVGCPICAEAQRIPLPRPTRPATRPTLEVRPVERPVESRSPNRVIERGLTGDLIARETGEIRHGLDLPGNTGARIRVVSIDAEEPNSRLSLAEAMQSVRELTAIRVTREPLLGSTGQERVKPYHELYVSVPKGKALCHAEGTGSADEPTIVFESRDSPQELRAKLIPDRFSVTPDYGSEVARILGFSLNLGARLVPDCTALLVALREKRAAWLKADAEKRAAAKHAQIAAANEDLAAGRVARFTGGLGEILGPEHPLVHTLAGSAGVAATRKQATIERTVRSLSPSGFVALVELLKGARLTASEQTALGSHLKALGFAPPSTSSALVDTDFALWSTIVNAHALRPGEPADRKSLQVELGIQAVAYVRAGLSPAASLSVWRYGLLPESLWQTREVAPWVLRQGGGDLDWRFAQALLASDPAPAPPPSAYVLVRATTDAPRTLRFTALEADGVYTAWTVDTSTDAWQESLARIRGPATVLFERALPPELAGPLSARPDLVAIDADAFAHRSRAASLRVARDGRPDSPTRVQLVADPVGRPLRVAFLRLDSRGDCIVIENSDGSVFVVDVGLGRGALDRLAEYFGGSPPPFRLLVTHRDADHIGGVPYAFEDGRFVIVEALFGQTAKAPKKIAAEAFAAMQRNGLKERALSTPTVRHFVNERLEGETLIRGEGVRDGDLNSWTLPLGSDGILEIYQYASPAVENQSGLVLKIRRKGRCILLTDDVDPVVMRVLTDASTAGRIDLGCGTLKWPHHVWFPRERSQDVAALKAFLAAVAPHTVVFSNSGHASHAANVAEARAFLATGVSVHTRSFWTWEDDTIVLQARMQ